MVREEGKRATAKRIRKYVEEKGGLNVRVTDTHEADRDTWTFKVSYQDSQGVQYHTRCKILQKLGNNNSPIYWLEELFQSVGKSKDVRLEEQTAVPPPPLPLSSKEQIISDLTAENERLQAKLEQLRQATERE